MGVHLKCFLLICALSVSYSTMTGGWTEISDDDSEAHKHAQYAADKISASTNSIYHMKITKVSNVRRQVVAGLNYNMNITLSPTECKKNHVNMTKVDIDSCPVLACVEPMSCNINVWVRAWLKEEGTKLTKSSCRPVPLENPC